MTSLTETENKKKQHTNKQTKKKQQNKKQIKPHKKNAVRALQPCYLGRIQH